MDKLETKARALRRFGEGGSNCCQAVLAAFAPEHRLEEKTACHVAACFGSGIGRLGLTCGAATGACMVLGLRHGQELGEVPNGRSKLYGRVQEFARRFRDRFGHIDCATLTGCDMTKSEGLQSFAERGLHAGLCTSLVAGAVEILEEMRE
jgi:C_GCAxxG_C_C family probable redox protein